MKYIYGLYNQNSINRLRYIGQTDDPRRRLREHWRCKDHPPRDDREWERRINEWIRSLSSPPSMRILLMVDDTEADRAEHDAIVEAQRLYGTGQLLNDNTGVDNVHWFRKLMNGTDLRVNPQGGVADNVTNIRKPRDGSWVKRHKPDIHIGARAQGRLRNIAGVGLRGPQAGGRQDGIRRASRRSGAGNGRGLRYLHVQWWVPFVVWFGLYIFVALGWIINGYSMEYLGWRHPGQPGKIHKVLVRFHTGAHIHPEKSYGDERRLRSIAGGSSRATPEGAIVYFAQRSRGYRAIRNNWGR